MRRLSGLGVFATALAAGALGWFITWWRSDRGHEPFPVPWTVIPVIVIAAGVVLALGWMVRQYQRGDRPDLDPLLAARTAMLSQAAAFAGAALAGSYGGHALALASYWDHEPRRAIAIAALVALGASALLAIAGFVAERWCATRGDGGDGAGKSPNITPEAA